ncbi:Bug family tripartite tricarboxylate transporter substrate binding protein [Aureimonas phyllosphaerae]|uniref:Tripartite-type tricarboxylate transporter receptor subunit TctC n=1 Tax=Aureimonas phyllosphaerae TaxID=1166078 RepID=A0A7W6BXR2_9HYPH|nr:tripartite tricarboxylate transporter substrate binding protein [Aureimonas phyllosphaerae]MBB3937078.1 tripartite-type tricarboxylate transporter receptor subunit TctC [Aureimonas phyllosphaerae]MBB3960807.1 tripartite-type tricarboxylate transporter receptor subunit TctC [Aureimonas phyllosphaerae]SFF50042.1 Tripartite-type tricarboxylate transporter, receptor component TctC [Aureimonas phyllosphaerae]
MLNRRLFCALALAATSLLSAPAAFAQSDDYPSRPVKLIVPYAAGGGTDAIARLVANGVGEKLGQSMVVENNGSAGGNVASQQAANADPDGYTVLMANQGPMVVNPHLFKNMKLDPLTAFDPVTLIAESPLVLVVSKNSPYKSFADLVAYGKANPGELTYGSAGNGSASHLATELFLSQAGLEAVHVPYKGAGPALNDMLGGRGDFMVTTLPSVLGLMNSGDMVPLAVTTTERVASLKDVPTIAESGYPDYVSAAWYGFAVPKGTPAPIIEKLRTATVEALAAPTVKERLEAEGAVIVGDTPQEFGDMMKAESQRWASFLTDAGISID